MKLGMSLKSGGKQAWNDNFELVISSVKLSSMISAYSAEIQLSYDLVFHIINVPWLPWVETLVPWWSSVQVYGIADMVMERIVNEVRCWHPAGLGCKLDGSWLSVSQICRQIDSGR